VNIEGEIRDFVNEEILGGEPLNGDPLADGMLDSLALEQLIAFVEERYDVMFEDEDLVAENFTDLRAVAGLIHIKMNANV
jgi:acyl carrier protein